MISLDQIKALEAKVHSAVDEITRLRRENQTLTDALTASEQRLRELEGLVGEFKNEQAEIEATIVRTLRNLDQLEDGLAVKADAGDSAAAAADPPAGELEAAHQAAAEQEGAVTAKGPLATGADGGAGEAAADGNQELEIF